MPARYDDTHELMLAALTDALESHGLGPRVGLLDPAVFPVHAGGVGIVVGLLPGGPAARLEAAALLAQMGCSWVKPCGIGVEGHLAGKLRVPAVPVRSADCCSAAKLASVTAVKACADCGEVKPLEEFSWRNREKGYRVPYCPPCASTRAAVCYVKRKA